jgi:uncharacterized protein (DUF1330 family)
MKAKYSLPLAMLVGAAFGALAVNGLSAQGRAHGVYAIVAFNEISDAAGFKTNVGDKAPDIVKKHGGTFIARTDNITPLRAAEPPIKRYVIIGFDNAQKAKDWYNSADMKSVNDWNDQHTKGRAFLVEGLAQ